MNRRGFITGLGAILGAATAPGLFLPKIEPVRWKLNHIEAVRWKLNPAWERAEHEIELITNAMNPENPFNQREFYGSWKFVSFDTVADAKAYPGRLSKVFV
jgi:hypothetical protein